MEAVVASVPSWDHFPEAFQQGFKAFRTEGVGQNLLMENNLFIEQVLPAAIVRKLTDEEMNTYRAPYPTPESRKPLWRWPNEIPIEGSPEDVANIVNTYNAWLGQDGAPVS